MLSEFSGYILELNNYERISYILIEYVGISIEYFAFGIVSVFCWLKSMSTAKAGSQSKFSKTRTLYFYAITLTILGLGIIVLSIGVILDVFSASQTVSLTYGYEAHLLVSAVAWAFHSILIIHSGIIIYKRLKELPHFMNYESSGSRSSRSTSSPFATEYTSFNDETQNVPTRENASLDSRRPRILHTRSPILWQTFIPMSICATFYMIRSLLILETYETMTQCSKNESLTAKHNTTLGNEHADSLISDICHSVEDSIFWVLFEKWFCSVVPAGTLLYVMRKRDRIQFDDSSESLLLPEPVPPEQVFSSFRNALLQTQALDEDEEYLDDREESSLHNSLLDSN